MQMFTSADWQPPLQTTERTKPDQFEDQQRFYRPEKTDQRNSHVRVLIVEDERLIAENLKYVLEEKGYEVIGIASSGDEAVLQGTTAFPDIVLMDIRIQGQFDGIEAAKRIRAFQGRDLPIIFLSAYAADHFPHLKDLRTDSYRYMKKPYSPVELFGVIRNMLTSH